MSLVSKQPRCPWSGTDPLYVTYHDTEWGAPVYEDLLTLFEFLILEGAQAFLRVCEELGSFNAYQWRFVDGTPQRFRRRSLKDVPATSKISDAFSTDLKQRGFKFVGSTIMYAHMQAVGMVNDHLVNCFRHRELAA